LLYKYEDYVFIYDYGKGKLYRGNHLLFKGNSQSAISQFLHETNNALEVRQMFSKQLGQRENPKKKEERKSKYEETKKPKKQEPKPEPAEKTKRSKTKTPWDD